MKRSIISLALVLSSTVIFGQTEFDALKVSQTEIAGSARYSALAGAFGALGGDASSLKDNPAGLGIFRKSEFTTTLDVLMQNSNSEWNGKTTEIDLFKYGFNNLSYIIALPTWRVESGLNGLQSSNFSLSYNKLKNFNNKSYIRSDNTASSITDYYANYTNNNYGYYTNSLSSDYLNPDKYPMNGVTKPYDNIQIPWMSIMAANAGLMFEVIDPITDETTGWESLLGPGEKVAPTYDLLEQGSIDEYSFGWSGNFSNRFYLGANINLQSLSYRSDSRYSETFAGGGNMNIDNVVTMSGMGYNLKLGAIMVPVDFIRLGLSLHTPMFYNITMVNYADLSSTEGNTQSTPENRLEYKQQTPMQFNVSAAFIIDTKALLSAEYVFNNYKGMRFQDTDGDYRSYNDVNDGMSDKLNNSRTIKIGGEYKLTPNFALRAGFANTSSATLPEALPTLIPNTTRTDPEYFVHNKTNYITAGIGYREASWYIDMAYVNRLTDQTFFAYDSSYLTGGYKVNPATVNTTNNNIVISVGLRF